MIFFYILSLFISMVLGYILMPRVLVISYKKNLFDVPDARKVHTVPVPRLGGITFFPIILITFFTVLGIRYTFFDHIYSVIPLKYLFSTLAAFIVGMTSLFLVGVADDLVGVGYRSKFGVQIIAAALFPVSGLYVNNLGGLFGIYEIPYWFGCLVTVFLVVYITNAINLIDGIDGLASGLSIISVLFLSTLCMQVGHYTYMFLGGATVGVLIIFFFFNVFGRVERKQKLFMGDTGSLALGYVISFLVIHFMQDTFYFKPWSEGLSVIAVSSLIVPLFDVVRVVLTRLRDKKHPFLPDKSHIHHKLLRTGMSKMQVMVTLLLTALFFIALNILLIQFFSVTPILIIDIVLWTAYNVTVNWFIRRKEKSGGSIWHVPGTK